MTTEIAGVVLSALSILVSIWLFRRQQADRQRISELETKALALAVEAAELEREQRNRAFLTATLYDSTVEIQNEGGADATNITIDYSLPRHPDVDVAKQARQYGQLEMKRLPPNGTARMYVMVLRESMYAPLHARIRWNDPDGAQRENDVPLYW